MWHSPHYIMEKLKVGVVDFENFLPLAGKKPVWTPPPHYITETECWTLNIRIQPNARHNARGILVLRGKQLFPCAVGSSTLSGRASERGSHLCPQPRDSLPVGGEGNEDATRSQCVSRFHGLIFSPPTLTKSWQPCTKDKEAVAHVLHKKAYREAKQSMYTCYSDGVSFHCATCCGVESIYFNPKASRVDGETESAWLARHFEQSPSPPRATQTALLNEGLSFKTWSTLKLKRIIRCLSKLLVHPNSQFAVRVYNRLVTKLHPRYTCIWAFIIDSHSLFNLLWSNLPNNYSIMFAESDQSTRFWSCDFFASEVFYRLRFRTDC